MTNRDRSPEEIEREIEAQRSDLSSNIEDLQEKFSVDTLVRQVGDHLREHGGDIGRSVSRQVKANPIPLALTGLGLAWLMVGGTEKPRSSDDRRRGNVDYDYDDDYARSVHNSGFAHDRRSDVAETYRDVPSWARDDDDAVGNDTSIMERVSNVAGQAKDAAARGGASVRDGASSAASSVSDGVVATGSRIAEGTESFSEEARGRVIAARQRAVQMSRQASQSLSRGSDTAQDFFEQQPLVVGALALAVGAALGGALPRTETEDSLVGQRSDDLMSEAERIFHEEKAKATRVAKAAGKEVKDIASETRADLDSGAPADKSAAEAVGEKAKGAAQRVADAVGDKAKSEGLGKPRA